MRVVLINPPLKADFPQPPGGLISIASVLEDNDHIVRIIDAPALRLSEREIVGLVDAFRPRVVGITSVTPTFNCAVSLSRSLKSVSSDFFIVFGGPHVSVLPEDTLKNNPSVDAVVIGEGEYSFLGLVECLDEGRDFRSIPGIATRSGDGRKIVVNRNSGFVDLDKLPMPSYHLLPIEIYRPYPPHGRKLPFMSVLTSRGCPYRCVYCSKSIFGSVYRYKSVDGVIEEIKHLIDNFGIREIMFYDDSFTINRERIILLCEEFVRMGLDIPWSCETRVNLVDKELLAHMKNAGCYMISYGVESGSQDILNTLCKDITLEQIKNAFGLTHDAGIKTVGYFILGSPGESVETIRKTISFSKDLDPDFAQFSLAVPYPGTKMYEMYKDEHDIDFDGSMWNNFFYANINSLDRHPPVFESDKLKRKDLIGWIRRAYKEFYFRPEYLKSKTLKIKSTEDVIVNIRGLKMLENVV